MADDTATQTKPEQPRGDHEVPFGSNEIRLTCLQWIVTLVISAAILMLLPVLWPRIEPFEPGPDYRMPFALSYDYWLYDRYCRTAVEQDKIPVIGDSVIWGVYVAPPDSLTHYMNKRTGGNTFANMGINGIHPLAMEGLVSYYAGGIANRKVILHFNPLWMTSKKADLSDKPKKKTADEEEGRVNHPRLIPQFSPKVLRYKAEGAQKISILVEHRVPFLQFFNHLAAAYYSYEYIDHEGASVKGASVSGWTTHLRPYGNPVTAMTLSLPEPEVTPLHEDVPWYENEKMKDRVYFPWVQPADSFQWHAFTRTLDTLRSRGNDVFVVVGPFNEHKMLDESRAVYDDIKLQVVALLEGMGVSHTVPEVLPGALYGDASHPLPKGYEVLAERLFDNRAFSTWLDAGD